MCVCPLASPLAINYSDVCFISLNFAVARFIVRSTDVKINGTGTIFLLQANDKVRRAIVIAVRTSFERACDV